MQDIISHAPIFFSVAILLGIVLAWFVVHYTYKPRISILEERIAFKEEKISEMESELKGLKGGVND